MGLTDPLKQNPCTIPILLKGFGNGSSMGVVWVAGGVLLLRVPGISFDSYPDFLWEESFGFFLLRIT